MERRKANDMMFQAVHLCHGMKASRPIWQAGNAGRAAAWLDLWIAFARSARIERLQDGLRHGCPTSRLLG